MAKAHSPGFIAIAAEARAQVQGCSVSELTARQRRGDALTLVDVREDDEFRVDHIPGAVHIGKGVIERDIETKVPDKATPLVLYCGGGYRPALAGAVLQKMGYQNVISLDGGIGAWREAGLPVQAGATPAVKP